MLALVLTATLVIVSACSTTGPGASTPSGSPTAASSVSELDVVAEVYRTRSDPARGGVQLSVRNDASAPLTIVHAALESPALAEPIERERTTEIAPGLTRDLALTLTAAACPAVSTAAPQAVLSVVLADGSIAELRVATTDRLGQWHDWVTSECLVAAVTDRATISVRHDAERDDGALIGLRFDVWGTAPGLSLIAVRDTVLFSLVQLDGARVTSVPLPGAVDDEAALSIPVLLTPARCDPHALADDKQGTLFRIDVELDGEPGVITVVADPPTRGALYDAFARACGLLG